MCLDRVAKKKGLPESVVAYKVFQVPRDAPRKRKGELLAFCQDTWHKPGVEESDELNLLLKAEDGRLYETGFHALADRAQAKVLADYWDDPSHRHVVRRVKLSKLVAKGKQNGDVVYVGRVMRIYAR